MRIAIVLANPSVSTTTGWPVGFWWSELTHPYEEFTKAGFEVEIFSPDGGHCEPDAMSDPRDPSGYSSHDHISTAFIENPALLSKLDHTAKVETIDPKRFDAILVAGGQSPMFSFEAATSLHQKFVDFYEAGKITAALCHGVAILKYARLSNGELLVKGKTVTGFANSEEDAADTAVWEMGVLSRDKHVMPWRIEDEMKRLGANYVAKEAWSRYATRDGNLITGQQNNSGAETARLVLAALLKP